ncbi:mechanosensitive ion channel-like protein [Roseivirga ehrenbergii]|uniref:Mechanosensitive ion channel protein MscS n=1 Tax=Roseivirga ehrenbergii (strain DSM 102268 / JCM 13514 / KCTC 12282 / NCIMB 14502 / KMM 6017) TaxID=279360 RepID=A0A150XRT6_ROSEK|nr:mechanosensitive ion channel family protein [Roseivirga ehrenbergii]KYG81411.1 mechanosensitive ion channel protein MscS [Roseivirga ehrenbergii]TCL10559.1 mechanosensitive ion channel-like protein [Roseivirga ehrenbergii]
MDFGINDAANIVSTKLKSWLEALTSMLPNIVVAVLVLIAFYFLSRLMKAGSRKLVSRFSDQAAIIGLFSTIIALVTIAIGLVVALNVLQLTKAVTSLLAGAGIIGLALGFAFQDISANFISGVIMAFRKPIVVGDIIETNGYNGFVEKIELRSTVIRTFQGLHVIIPNKDIFQNPFTNYTRTHTRRIDLEVGVSYGDDLDKVTQVVEKAVASNSHLVDGQPVKLVYEEFGSSSINFRVMFWIEYDPKKPMYLEAKSEAIKAIKKAFDANDIMIPFPIRTLDFGIKGGEKLSEQIETKQMKLLPKN